MARLPSATVATTVGSAMVGAGIFIVPGLLLEEGASAGVILALFAGAGVVAAIGVLVFGELASRHPQNGGAFVYLLRYIGPGAAYLFNWSRFSVMQTGALAILALTSTRFGAAALGLDSPLLGVPGAYWEAVAALALLASTAFVNTRGLSAGTRVQAALTALKVGAILAFIFGAASASGSWPEPLAGSASGAWLLAAIFAYGGWTQVLFLAGDADGKRMAHPMLLAVGLVTLLYLGATAAMLWAAPGAGGTLAVEAARNLWGPTGAKMLATVVAVAALGTLNTMSLTGPRLYEEAAKARLWNAGFAAKNDRDAPATALWWQALWAGFLVACSLLAENAFLALIGAIGTAIWLFHGLTIVAWFRARGEPTTFMTPGGKFTAALFGVAVAIVLGLAMIADIEHLIHGRWANLHSFWALALVFAGGAAWRMRTAA